LFSDFAYKHSVTDSQSVPGAQYRVHPTQISQWKRQLGAEAKETFGSRRLKKVRYQEVVQASVYEEIGRLTMELEWVKKTAGLG